MSPQNEKALGVADAPQPPEDLKWSVWDYVPRWLTRDWYAYLLRRPDHYDRALGWAYTNRVADYANRVWCRLRGHPAGVIWFNPGALEPDNHCKNCGDEIA